MNAKKVKLIRKQLGYHPTDKRNYARYQAGIVVERCTRVAYLRAKGDKAS